MNTILLSLKETPLWMYLISIICIIDVFYLFSFGKNKISVWRFRKLYTEDIDLILQKIKLMNGWEFEDFMAYLFKLDGYKVEQTPKTNDKGTDIILNNNIYVECKNYDQKSLIGREFINKLVGSAYGLSGGKGFKTLFITTSSYNKNAIEFARLTGTELWNTDNIIKLISKLNTSEILRYLDYDREIWESQEIKNSN